MVLIGSFGSTAAFFQILVHKHSRDFIERNIHKDWRARYAKRIKVIRTSVLKIGLISFILNNFTREGVSSLECGR